MPAIRPSAFGAARVYSSDSQREHDLLQHSIEKLCKQFEEQGIFPPISHLGKRQPEREIVTLYDDAGMPVIQRDPRGRLYLYLPRKNPTGRGIVSTCVLLEDLARQHPESVVEDLRRVERFLRFNLNGYSL